MPHPGPNATSRGLISAVAVRLRRAFGFTKTGSSQNNGRRAQLSNAEYHLSHTELQKIIDAASSPRDRVLLQAMAETGLRRAEAAAISVNDLRLEDCLLIVANGKGQKTRVVPITKSLVDSLAQLVRARVSGPVFASPGGSHLSLRQINRIVAAAGRRAGVRNPNPRQRSITCHLFRHSFARLWKAHGGSIESLAKILGHASVKTTWDLYGTEGLADIRRNYRQTMQRMSRRRDLAPTDAKEPYPERDTHHDAN